MICGERKKETEIETKRDGNKETGNDRYGRGKRHRQIERDEGTHKYEMSRVKAKR